MPEATEVRGNLLVLCHRLGSVESKCSDKFRLLDSRELLWIWEQVKNYYLDVYYPGRWWRGWRYSTASLGEPFGLCSTLFQPCESPLTPQPCSILPHTAG